MTFLYDGRLNELDMNIALMIETDPTIITSNNIFEAARILGVSASKLTKYCQKISLNGFKEIKYKLEQEVNREKYLNEEREDFDVGTIVDAAYHRKLFQVPKLIEESKKILIVSSNDDSALGDYLALKFRKNTMKDVVAYTIGQNFSFEYLNSDVLSILIDEQNEFESQIAAWYRRGHKYVHITAMQTKVLDQHIPILVSVDAKLPFDAQVLLIFKWLSNYSAYI